MIQRIFSVALFITFSIGLNAQTKQDIYCNEDIVWAGISEIDVVIDADSNIDWKTYKISNLGSFYKQYERDLKENPKPLNEIIVDDGAQIEFYPTDELDYPVDYNWLEWTDPMYEPENFGDQGGRFPASAFDVFRLRCYLYFDKSKNEFQLSPFAVGVMRSVYDAPDEVFDYEILGWMPVNEWKENFLEDKNITFAKRFYRDIDFEEIYVFKKEWHLEKVLDTMMTYVRSNARTIELYETTYDSLDGSRRLEVEEIKTLCTDEIMAVRFDETDYEDYEIQLVPWSASQYAGLRLTIDWAWNSSKHTFHATLNAYSPYEHFTNDFDEVLYLKPLFLRKVSK